MNHTWQEWFWSGPILNYNVMYFFYYGNTAYLCKTIIKKSSLRLPVHCEPIVEWVVFDGPHEEMYPFGPNSIQDIVGCKNGYYFILFWFDLLCLTPLSAIFQLYHGDQF